MNNALYYGDNLDIIKKYVADGSVDLIYLDPPFNSKASYNILYKEPTEPMKLESITKGFYRSKILQKDYPRIQILTIEETLSGKQPNIPYQLNPYKKAEMADTSENLSLDFDHNK